MKIEIEIKAEAIANLMISAIEGGDPVTNASKGGWCDGIYYRTKAAKPPVGIWYADSAFYDSRDFQIEVVEVDDESTGHRTSHIITRPNLIAGLKVMVAKFPADFGDIFNDNADAATADIFLQCVCFGEDRYA